MKQLFTYSFISIGFFISCSNTNNLYVPVTQNELGIFNAHEYNSMYNIDYSQAGLGNNPYSIAIVERDDITILFKLVSGSKYSTLITQIINNSDQDIIVNPFDIKLLDKNRINIEQIGPDVAANYIASYASNAPKYQPKYIVTSDADINLNFIDTNTASITANQKTTIERDPYDQAIQNFADSFTAGFNKSILEIADNTYMNGFHGPERVSSKTGIKKNIYFRSLNSNESKWIIKVGKTTEIVFKQQITNK